MWQFKIVKAINALNSIIAHFIIPFPMLSTAQAASFFDANIPDAYRSGTITCSENQPCTIICDETYSCYSATITCPKYATCDLQCITDYACDSATITWPLVEGYGILTCQGTASCQSINFPDNPESTDSLIRTCDDPIQFSASEIYCPDSASCTLNCDGLFSCQSVCFIILLTRIIALN